MIRRMNTRLCFWLGYKRACPYIPSEDSPGLRKSESERWGTTSSYSISFCWHSENSAANWQQYRKTLKLFFYTYVGNPGTLSFKMELESTGPCLGSAISAVNLRWFSNHTHSAACMGTTSPVFFSSFWHVGKRTKLAQKETWEAGWLGSWASTCLGCLLYFF